MIRILVADDHAVVREGLKQIIAAGLDQYFAPEGCTVVEWWDRWQGEAPPGFCQVLLENVTETQRRITYVEPRS